MALIAHWTLDGNAKDYSGNGYDGVMTNSSWVNDGKIGQALSLNSANNGGVNIPHNFINMEEFTMSAWVRPKGNHRNYNGAIISSGNWNTSCWTFGLSQNNSAIDVASGGYNRYINYNVPLNEWTHILSVRRSDGRAYVYVNGELIGSVAVSGTNSDASNTYIGRETYAGGYFSFNGDINDVRIYDEALSEKEIQDIYKGLVAHYKFNEGDTLDSSGFENHAQTSRSVESSDDTQIGLNSLVFNGTNSYVRSAILPESPELTLSLWFKPEDSVNGERLFWGAGTDKLILYISTGNRMSWFARNADGPNTGYTPTNVQYKNNQWNHAVIRFNGTTYEFFLNGVKDSVAKTLIGSNMRSALNFGTNYNSGRNFFKGKMADIRYYVTALSDDDILDLYKVRAEVNDTGVLFAKDFKERENLFDPLNQALAREEFINGLSSYQQGHCIVSFKNGKYNIFRTPNLNYSGNNVMWGGLRVDMDGLPGGNPLKKGRTYKIILKVHGMTSNPSTTHMFSNNMGWGGGGLVPTPTILKPFTAIPTNFNDTKYLTATFKIEDDIRKVCTTSYSSFVKGNTYTSYKHFQLGWGYQSTGALGTDIYITEFYLFDVTDDEDLGDGLSIKDTGVAEFNSFSTAGITDGLETYIPMTDGKIRDLALGSNQPALEISGSPIDKNGYFEFTGSQQVDTKNLYPIKYEDPYTIMVEVRLPEDITQTPGDKQAAIVARGNYNGAQGLSVDRAVKNFIYTIRWDDSNMHSLTLGEAKKGEWVHLVAIWDGVSRITGFQDGVKQEKIVTPVTTTDPTLKNPTWIIFPSIAFSGASGGRMSGGIRNFKAFNRALSDEEVMLEFNTIKNREVQIHEHGTMFATKLLPL